MGTRGQWGTDFAKALGNPNPSASTVNWIAAWTKLEGTKAKFNPLATTLDYGKNTCFNSVCVRNYETRQQGIEAAAQTLNGNHPGYNDIREGIRLDDPQRAANGLIRAPWGTNGALVQNTWALYDVRNEPLLSEEGQAEKPFDRNATTKIDETKYEGGTKTEYDPILGIVPISSTTAPSERGGKPHTLPGRQSDTANLDDYTRIGYGIFAFFFLSIALFLIIRNYVPTQQVVKTIAAIA